MKCPNCGNENFDTISKSKGKIHGGTGFFGIGRLFLIICTCGLWFLVPKNKGKIKSITKFVCKKCGNEFNLKQITN